MMCWSRAKSGFTKPQAPPNWDSSPIQEQSRRRIRPTTCSRTATTSHYVGTAIDLEKFTNGQDADEPTGPIIRVGDPVMWNYRVTNPSPVNLTNVEVVDPDLPAGVMIIRQPDASGNGDDLLEPYEVWIYQATGIAQLGQFANTGTVTALDPSENVLQDSDDSHYLGKEIAGLTGYVYVDANDNGVRDAGEGGVPGILVALSGVTSEDAVVGPITAMTSDDGSYAFIDIPPGTYELSERQAFALIDGQDSLGTLGGTLEPDRFTDIVVPRNVIGEEYIFGELGLKPEFVSKRLFLATGAPIEWYYREAVALGEEFAGNPALARATRDASIPSTITAPSATAVGLPDTTDNDVLPANSEEEVGVIPSIVTPAPAITVVLPATLTEDLALDPSQEGGLLTSEATAVVSAGAAPGDKYGIDATVLDTAHQVESDGAISTQDTRIDHVGIHEGFCVPLMSSPASSSLEMQAVDAAIGVLEGGGVVETPGLGSATIGDGPSSTGLPAPYGPYYPGDNRWGTVSNERSTPAIIYGPQLPELGLRLPEQEYLHTVDEIFSLRNWLTT